MNTQNRLYTERIVILDTMPGQRLTLFPTLLATATTQ
ncbi:hypothetical protein N836_01910 [Leptolyngbya sp. Heron Island J]|nr:hypothetical protein N836_01910 [Leptolyngbya sp. Heron Island J]